MPLARGRQVLLFVDRRAPGVAPLESRFNAMKWPPGTEPEVVDLARDDERSRWYGITRGPTIAVVCDGVLLAIEHECNDHACSRLNAAASCRDPRAFEGLLP